MYILRNIIPALLLSSAIVATHSIAADINQNVLSITPIDGSEAETNKDRLIIEINQEIAELTKNTFLMGHIQNEKMFWERRIGVEERKILEIKQHIAKIDLLPDGDIKYNCIHTQNALNAQDNEFLNSLYNTNQNFKVFIECKYYEEKRTKTGGERNEINLKFLIGTNNQIIQESKEKILDLMTTWVNLQTENDKIRSKINTLKLQLLQY